MLALHCMHKYLDVRIEDGASMGGEKVRSTEWGGDVEVRLLAIAIGREIVVTGSGDTFTSARKFPCQRGGIFIPIEITELFAQWKNYKPSPLLIIYNGINHYGVCTCIIIIIIY